MRGSERVADALREELGIDFGETTPDGEITLERTPCIGMCDQAPAALVNDVVVTDLSADMAREVVARSCREHMDPQQPGATLGDGNNAHDLVRADGPQQHPPAAARCSSPRSSPGEACARRWR